MRKVSLFTTGANTPKEILSSATTWGQLKPEVSGHIKSDMKATLRETRIALTDDNLDYVLPEGEIIIFLTPNKMKSGLNG
jgi:hypothetical protein